MTVSLIRKLTDEPQAFSDSERRPWPTPDEAAFHGVAGEYVRLADPHTEADPVAVLAQFLVMAGTAAGRNRFFAAGADKHFTNENVVIVGPTSVGRKGASRSVAEQPIVLADSSFRERTQTGLSSGEGLINAVRDGDDGAVSDGRLVAIEPEFGSVQSKMKREGNALSPVLRNAWDGTDLQTMTKSAPIRATGALISLIGHVTQPELIEGTTKIDVTNGLMNRNLWILSRRGKLLPEGGNFYSLDLGPIVRQLRSAFDYARKGGEREIRRDAEAREIWIAVYPDLSRGEPGLLGAITARAEAHVMRLALIYSTLDCAEEIRKEHLLAALALWDYSLASARYIFGDSLGDADADKILGALRDSHPAAMTRTQISDTVFHRNRKANEIERALAVLEAQGLAECSAAQSDGGRPAEVWTATR